MGLETATTIEELNENWPLPSDNRSQGDDHIRLLKEVLKSELASGRIGGGKGATGEIFYFAGATPPDGALACDGQQISQTTYAELYAAIGDVWANTGGAADPVAGNFRVPPRLVDGHGAFPRAVESGAVGTAYSARVLQHSHTMNHDHAAFNEVTNVDGSHGHDLLIENAPGYPGDQDALSWSRTNDSIGYENNGGINDDIPLVVAGAHSHTVNINIPNYTGSTGNTGTTNDNRPPSLGLLMCIWHGEVS